MKIIECAFKTIDASTATVEVFTSTGVIFTGRMYCTSESVIALATPEGLTFINADHIVSIREKQ